MSKNVDVKADLSVKNKSVVDPKNAKKQEEGHQPHEDLTEMQYGFVIASVLGVGAIASSGGGSSSSSSIPNESVSSTGYFVDAPVQGIQYTTSSGLSGVTGAGGSFSYAPGDTVTFTVGNVTIGSYDTDNIASDGVVMPQDIVGVDRSDVAHPVVLQIGRFLQTLDADDDLTNGITISEEAIAELEVIEAVDLSVSGITDQMLANLVQAVDPTLTLISIQDAIAHYIDTLQQFAPDAVVDESTFETTLELVTLAGTLTQGGEEGLVYRLSFSEPVNFNVDDLMVSGGSITHYVESEDTPNTYMLLVSYADLTSSTVRIDFPESVAMNYKGFVNTVAETVLTDMPAFVSNIRVNNGEPVNIETAQNGITVTGYGLPGALVTVNGTVASGGDTPATWTVTLQGPFEVVDGEIVIDVSATMPGVEGVNDYTTSIAADLTAPDTPIVELGEDTGLPSDGITNNPQMIVSGFNQEDLVLYSLNDGLSWQELVGDSFDLNEGENTVIVKAVDAAGNESPESSPITLTYDATAVEVDSLTNDAEMISLATGNVTYTVTFSEGISGFDGQNIEITNGTLASVPVPVDGVENTYRFAVTPDEGVEGNLTVSISGVMDEAGNAMVEPASMVSTVDTLAPEIVPVFSQAAYEPEFVGSAMDSTVTITISSAVADLLLDPENGWPLSVKVNDVTVDVLDIIVYDGTLIDITLDTTLSRSDIVTVSGTLSDDVGNILTLSNAAVRNETEFFESVSTPAFIASAQFVERDADGEANYIELLGDGFYQFLDTANGADSTSDVSSQFDFSRLTFYTDVMDEFTGTTLSSLDVEKTNIYSDGSIRIYLTESAVNGLMMDENFGASTNGVIVQPEFIGHPTFVLSQAELMAEDGAFTSMSFTYMLGSEPVAPDAHVKSITLLGTGSYSGNQILVEGADVVAGGIGNITLTDIPSHINSISSVQLSGTLTIESWAGDIENKIITGQEGSDEGTIIVKALADSFDLGSVVTGIELVGDGITLETDGTLANFAFGNGSQLLKVNEMPVVDGQVSVSGFDALADDIDLTALGAIFADDGMGNLASTAFKSYAGALEAGNIDADDRILFDSTTGVVSYDADGSGAGSEAVTLFILTGPTVMNNPTAITAEDFRVAVA